jgi:hypothetical protein
MPECYRAQGAGGWAKPVRQFPELGSKCGAADTMCIGGALCSQEFYDCRGGFVLVKRLL